MCLTAPNIGIIGGFFNWFNVKKSVLNHAGDQLALSLIKFYLL